ncbi:MAG: hypothetical protein ABR613_02955 [Actinomycetota bacterium]
MFGYGFGVLDLVIVPLALVGIVLLGIIALAGDRGALDAGSHRAYALYLSLVSFVAIFTVLYAVASIAAPLAKLAFLEADETTVDCSTDPLNPECRVTGATGYVNVFGGPREAETAWTRDALNAAALGVAAGAVLMWHRRRTRALVDDSSFRSSPGERTYIAYLYAVSFVAVMVVIGAGTSGLFALTRAIAPGLVTDGPPGDERETALVQLVTAAVTAAGAAVVYVTHWNAARTARAAPTSPQTNQTGGTGSTASSV